MVRNEIAGAAQLPGVVIRAGQIHGGIHHHAVAQDLPLPRQLPRVPPLFTSREDAAGTLSAARRDGTTLAVISGLAGVGKTALAARWLAADAAEGEAQLHADLDGSAARFAGEGRMSADPEAAARLAERCAHLPLVLASARLKSRPAPSLSAAADYLVHHDREDPARMAITTGLTESYDSLEASAQYVYRLLGLLPVDVVDPDMVAAVCRLEWGEADWLLEVLADEHLLEPCESDADQPVRYRVGSAVREHMRARSAQPDSADDRESVVRRLCEWMLAIATQAQQRLTPAQGTLRRTLPPPADVPAVFNDDPGAMAWLEAHEHDLLGVLQATVTAGLDEVAWQLVDAFWPLFLRRHPYALWAKAHEIGLAAARRAGNAAAVRQMLLSGAIGLSSAGRLTDAIGWYTQALDAARADGDVRDEGQALLGLGSCHHNAGRPQQARPLLNQAITLWEACGYPRGVALATIVLGETTLAEDPGQAVDLFARARTMLLAAEDPYDASRALVLQGHAHVLVGDADSGVRELESALAALTDTGSTLWRARALEYLGQAYSGRGETAAPRECYQQAADLYGSIRPADAERVRALAGDL